MESGQLAVPSTVDGFERELDAMLALLDDLVSQDTPASSKAGLDQMVEQLADELLLCYGSIDSYAGTMPTQGYAQRPSSGLNTSDRAKVKT